MRRIKLTKYEQAIEDAAEEYVDVPKAEFERLARALARRRKDAVISIRINSYDLKQLKEKAKKLGIRYQTLITEILHRVAT